LKACTGQLSSLEKKEPNLTAAQRAQRDAIEVYIAEHLREQVEESAAVARAFPTVNKVRGEHVLAERAIARHPHRSPDEIQNADAVVAKTIADQSKGLAALQTPLGLWSLAVMMAGFAGAFVGVLSLIGSLAARG